MGYQDPTKRGLPVLLALRAKRGAINLYAVLSRNPANVCLCLRIFDCLNFYLNQLIETLFSMTVIFLNFYLFRYHHLMSQCIVVWFDSYIFELFIDVQF